MPNTCVYRSILGVLERVFFMFTCLNIRWLAHVLCSLLDKQYGHLYVLGKACRELSTFGRMHGVIIMDEPGEEIPYEVCP